MKLNDFLKEEIMKKIILGTSDAWSMSRSSLRPSDPAYYIEDCWILDLRAYIVGLFQMFPSKLKCHTTAAF